MNSTTPESASAEAPKVATPDDTGETTVWNGRGLRIAAAALLIALLLGLASLKWGSSLRAVLAAQASGKYDFKLTPYISSGIIGNTWAYFHKVWIALLLGVLIGGTLRVAVAPSTVVSYLGGRGAKSMLVGALAGIPLMLCSCCVTPVFSGLHKRGARLGPSLSILFAAPGLNIAALALTLVMFPIRFGAIRIVAALLLVFAFAPLIGRAFESSQRARGESETCAVPAEEPFTWRTFPLRWLKSVGYMAAMTLPLVLVGVALSSVLLPHLQSLTQGNRFLAIAVTALIASLIALPTFLEVPLALSLLAAGAPAGAAVALLVAGPVINLPSLIILSRDVTKRVALSIFVGVWLLASLAGFACEGFPS